MSEKCSLNTHGGQNLKGTTLIKEQVYKSVQTWVSKFMFILGNMWKHGIRVCHICLRYCNVI